MEPINTRAGCLNSPLARLGLGLGAAIVVIMVLVVLGGGDDDETPAAGTDDAGDSTPTVDDETADDIAETADDEFDEDVFEEDETVSAPTRSRSGNYDVTASTGETFTTVFTAAETADLIIIGAPSRNADLNSLTPVANMFAQNDCASFVSFNAVTLSETSPLEAYLAIFDAIFGELLYGEFGGPSGTLGGSFTGLPAYLAGAQRGSSFAIVMSPSDPFPADAPIVDEFHPSVYYAELDLPFAEQFESWQGVGFDSTTFPGGDHGTDIFTGADGQDALADLQTRYCF